MFKTKLRHVFLVYLIVSTAFTSGYAQQKCGDYLSPDSVTLSKTDPVELLAYFELKVKDLAEIYSTEFGHDPKLGEALGKLTEEFEELILALDSSSGSEHSFAHKMGHLSKKINEFQEKISLLRQRHTNTDLEYAMSNPKVLAENRLYVINGMDPNVERVAFSKEVLESVFWSDEPLMHRASDLIFRALKRGRQFATEKSGVFPFESDRSVFKIKIIGEAVGSIRVAGFFVGRDFYVVDWTNDSNHGSSKYRHIVDRVNLIRAQYLKTSKY